MIYALNFCTNNQIQVAMLAEALCIPEFGRHIKVAFTAASQVRIDGINSGPVEFIIERGGKAEFPLYDVIGVLYAVGNLETNTSG
ncbi:hypothetical protein C0068_01375 [Zhongshania marina]|uniref:Uncharacterized protein n=1 Tax=Zhongshania marina TaxID=2304603 RepID=A0A2S4HKE3_9GAMM|nr:hypothetical protein C0068_01375 [Marortus luteolus]